MALPVSMNLLKPCRHRVSHFLSIFAESRTDECPSPYQLTSRCVKQCSYDSDCSRHQKCCYNGRGHTCETSRECKYQKNNKLKIIEERKYYNTQWLR